MKIFSSLHTRLVLSHLLVSLVSITLISAFAARSFFDAARADFESSMDTQASIVRHVLETDNLIQEYLDKTITADDIRAKLFDNLKDYPDYGFSVYLVDGTSLTDKSEGKLQRATLEHDPEVWAAFNSDSGKGLSIRSDPQGDQRIYVAVRVTREAQIMGTLRLSAPLEPALARARRDLALLLLVALVVASAVSWFGWLLANNLARPIQRLTEAAEQMAGGNLDVRVSPSGTQELLRLAEAFNAMAGRIKNHIDELRAFVANASHELRTPLTVVKLRTEALRDGALQDLPVADQFLEDIENEVDRLVRMVNDLLDLSRLEAGLTPGTRGPLNLGVIAGEVFDTFKIRALRAGVTLSMEAEPDLPMVMGNEDQLRRLFYNLVENGIKYTPSGGQVEILLRRDTQGKMVRLLVRDTGTGISGEHLKHVFERFYRAETTRPRTDGTRGSGLGLAIAKSIVEIHGGEMGVNSQIGVGSSFWADLPVAESSNEHAT